MNTKLSLVIIAVVVCAAVLEMPNTVSAKYAACGFCKDWTARFQRGGFFQDLQKQKDELCPNGKYKDNCKKWIDKMATSWLKATPQDICSTQIWPQCEPAQINTTLADAVLKLSDSVSANCAFCKKWEQKLRDSGFPGELKRHKDEICADQNGEEKCRLLVDKMVKIWTEQTAEQQCKPDCPQAGPQLRNILFNGHF